MSLLTSRKGKGKADLRKWVLESSTIIPQGLKDKMRELREKHRQAIEGKRLSTSSTQHELQAIQYNNVGLQGEIKAKDKTIKDLIENRHVPRCGEYDNILIVFQKNKPVEDDIQKSRHAFYMMRCQKKQKDILLARIKKEYPNIVEKGRCEDPNAVH